MAYGIEVMTSEGMVDLARMLGLKLIMTHEITVESGGSVSLPSGVNSGKCVCIPSSGFVSAWVSTGDNRMYWNFPFGGGGGTYVSIMVVESS